MDKQEASIVFRGIVEAESNCRFYGALAEEFSRLNRRFLVAMSALSLATIIASLLDLPYNVPVALAAFVLVAALWLSYHNYSRRAGTAAGIASVCLELIDEWEELWFSGQNVSGRSKELKQRITRVTSQALMEHGFYDSKHHKKLLKRCGHEAEDYWEKSLNA